MKATAPPHNNTTNTTMPIKYFIVEESAVSFITGSDGSGSTATIFSGIASGSVFSGFSSSTSGSGSTNGSSTTVSTKGSSIVASSTKATFSSTSCSGVLISVSSSSSLSFSCRVSSSTVASFKTTVSKCENGLLIISFKAGSGVNDTFVCPCISNLSPVFTLTLSRLPTSISLKVPKPRIFTYLSFSKDSSISWKNSFTKLSAFFLLMPCLSASVSIRSCMFSFSFIIREIF